MRLTHQQSGEAVDIEWPIASVTMNARRERKSPYAADGILCGITGYSDNHDLGIVLLLSMDYAEAEVLRNRLTKWLDGFKSAE